MSLILLVVHTISLTGLGVSILSALQTRSKSTEGEGLTEKSGGAGTTCSSVTSMEPITANEIKVQ